MSMDMHLGFNAGDVLEIAKRIERRGWQFYNNASQTVRSTKVSNLLLALAKAELKHEERFAEMVIQLQETQDSPKMDRETQFLLQDFVASWANEAVFFPEDGLVIDPDQPPENILGQALEFEKKTIQFYQEIIGFLSSELHRKLVKEIIGQEQKHAQRIADLLKQLADD
jgi:rubrerythrin